MRSLLCSNRNTPLNSLWCVSPFLNAFCYLMQRHSDWCNKTMCHVCFLNCGTCCSWMRVLHLDVLFVYPLCSSFHSQSSSALFCANFYLICFPLFCSYPPCPSSLCVSWNSLKLRRRRCGYGVKKKEIAWLCGPDPHLVFGVILSRDLHHTWILHGSYMNLSNLLHSSVLKCLSEPHILNYELCVCVCKVEECMLEIWWAAVWWKSKGLTCDLLMHSYNSHTCTICYHHSCSDIMS